MLNDAMRDGPVSRNVAELPKPLPLDDVSKTVILKPEHFLDFVEMCERQDLGALWMPVRLAHLGLREEALAAIQEAADMDHRRQWRRDLYPSSALLRAEFQFVPFYGREDTLIDLPTWAGSDRPVGVGLYTGARGMGKTRLMTELCGQLGSDG